MSGDSDTPPFRSDPHSRRSQMPMVSSGAQPFDPKRTQIVSSEGSALPDPTRTQIYQGPGASPQPRQAPQNRKIVGWLISFSLHPNGVDFRLYEGRNTIGTDPKCDIVIHDPAASGHHLTILYRAGQFLFRDELSTNGTFINGTMQNEGVLQDGDRIQIGHTEFRFRTV
ncbi:MAG: FHA domain-containing protein [Bacteroidia bacterium]|nr:FHA domain-containing protein [Bacteroidia bacterium]